MSDCVEMPGTHEVTLGYRAKYVHGRREYSHRIAYMEAYGEIPEGAHIHHKCENPGCANPEHLEALSVAEHVRRHPTCVSAIHAARTHCPKGHPLSGDNLVQRSTRRSRECKTCNRERMRIANRTKEMTA